MKYSEKIYKVKADIELNPALAAFFDTAQPQGLFRINLKILSRQIGLPLTDLLTTFLRLVDAGLFNLSWEYHCPHCNAIPGFKHDFGELKSEGECGLCNLSFRNTLDKNIEVTFTAHPTLAEIPPEIAEQAKEQMLTAVAEKRLAMPEVFLSGLECLNNEMFRELFGEQVLSTQESLAVETATFLFTDIKGSTQMYSDMGDARSYDIVREHFKILFAALDAHREFASRELSQAGYLRIKMGIHSGSAIVVNLNRSVDYFGNSVNLAARVQSSVENHEVSFTKRVLDDQAVHTFLRSKRARLRHKSAVFKGINGHVDVYTLSPEVVASWT